MLRCLLEELDRYYSIFLYEGMEPILDVWEKRNCTLGREIILKQGDNLFRGTAVNITQEGGLVLKDFEGSERVFYSGDATVIK
ncbi:MAG: hypothetical protein GX318_06840 [Clostridia bacterium]|nr:hypothetical protein [Clostridia bacterium]